MVNERANERAFAVEVVRTLQQAGHEALWAGGCVRDELLGIPPADYDVATSARPDAVQRLFPRTIAVGASFGVVEVLGPRTEAGYLSVQVATFRSDGPYHDGRHPESITYSDAREDALRRDFTINGLFYDPIAEQLYDYVGGQADLAARRLRAIGDPYQRFGEDKLRLLRAARFAARFELTIEPSTAQAVRDMAEQLVMVSAERIADELQRLLTHPRRVRGLEWLVELKLLGVVFPELTRAGVAVADLARRLGRLPEPVTFPLALAALLGELDGQAVQGICERLRLSNAQRDRVVWLVAQGDTLRHARTLPLHVVKPLLAHPGADELLALSQARAEAAGLPTAEVDWCRQRRADWQAAGTLNPAPLLTGQDLLNCGIKPGPQFKQLLERVRQAQLDESIHTSTEALALVKQSLRESPGP
jgi:poly(A) polymerase